MNILHRLMNEKNINRSIEFMDNRISLYAAQQGRCAVTGKILDYDEIHCHHILPIKYGGDDKYRNLKIVHKDVHFLIHSVESETILKYLSKVKPTDAMLEKINCLRTKAKLIPIKI